MQIIRAVDGVCSVMSSIKDTIVSLMQVRHPYLYLVLSINAELLCRLENGPFKTFLHAGLNKQVLFSKSSTLCSL